MLVSTKGRYALRILLELAQYDRGRYMPLPLIAEKQDISEKYLESIVSLLVRASGARAAATACAARCRITPWARSSG